MVQSRCQNTEDLTWFLAVCSRFLLVVSFCFVYSCLLSLSDVGYIVCLIIYVCAFLFFISFTALDANKVQKIFHFFSQCICKMPVMLLLVTMLVVTLVIYRATYVIMLVILYYCLQHGEHSKFC